MQTESIVLRTYRRKFALTQHELASLIGFSSVHLSRVERSKTAPGLKFALASEIVFGTHAKELFPKLFNDLEDEIVRNIYLLGESLKDNPSQPAARKRQFIDEVLNRAAKSPEKPNDV